MDHMAEFYKLVKAKACSTYILLTSHFKKNVACKHLGFYGLMQEAQFNIKTVICESRITQQNFTNW